MSDYSLSIAEAVREVLEESGTPYSFDKKDGIFELEYSKSIYRLTFMFNVGEDRFLEHACWAVKAKPENTEQMNRLARYVCGINNDIYMGRFCLDFETGLMYYSHYKMCTDDRNRTKDDVRDGIVYAL